VVDADKTKLLGAVLVGDAKEYNDLLQMMLNGFALPETPESLIMPGLLIQVQKQVVAVLIYCQIAQPSVHVTTSLKQIFAKQL
jgi:NAD(P)H-nitrite reductase large subunit